MPSNEEKKKAYYQANKDKLKVYFKEHYQENKDKIKASRLAKKNKGIVNHAI